MKVYPVDTFSSGRRLIEYVQLLCTFFILMQLCISAFNMEVAILWSIRPLACNRDPIILPIYVRLQHMLCRFEFPIYIHVKVAALSGTKVPIHPPNLHSESRFGQFQYVYIYIFDSCLQIARILRPLRIITVVSRLKIIVDTLFSSLPELSKYLLLCRSYLFTPLYSLGSVMVFLVFFLALSSILGVQLFQGNTLAHILLFQLWLYSINILGDFHQRCGAFNGSSFIFEEPWDNMLCSMSSEPSYGMHVCDANATCGISAETPMNGIISYDNFLDALLVNTIAISIGLWSTFMSWMEQVNGAWAEVYFIFLELFGSLFVLELVVAVLFSHLESNKRLYYQSLHEKMPPLKRRNATRDILALEEPPPSLCCRSIRYGEELYCKLSKQEAKPSATVEDTDVSR